MFPTIPVTTLAQRVDFGSRTQPARAFQERYATDVQHHDAMPHGGPETTGPVVTALAAPGRATS